MQVIVNGQTLIDSMIDVVPGTTQSITGTSSPTLTAATAPNEKLVPIRIRYYQATQQALIALYWKVPGATAFEIIGSSALYHKTSVTSITAAANILTARHTPRMATGLAQGSSLTYAATQLTLAWAAPVDTGCLPISDYTIQATLQSDDLAWVNIATGVAGALNSASGKLEAAVSDTGGTSYVVAGQSVSLRVVANNARGAGQPSDRITLVPAALPSAPAAIRVCYTTANP